jgi:signal transduction histidine kinase
VEVLGDEEFATLRVTDHGIGISLEHQRKIFNRFDRAISANEISGLGLGLFITNYIVAAHGGQVRLRSEPGIGSVFELRFPLVRAFRTTVAAQETA